MARERWGSKLGVILAVAGSAIGLGNFLRFPGMAANNGGGAFMIPYFVALLLLGLPLMWIEWTLGRFGGGFGHSTAPGMFHSLAEKRRFLKYFGVIGIFGPIIIFVYYTYIESWLLGYSVFALTGKYAACESRAAMSAFLDSYRGLNNEYFPHIGLAYLFFVITFLANIAIVAWGIRRGIQRVCEWALPLLFILAIILVVRVFTLGTPDAQYPQHNVGNGLGFLWNPDWSQLGNARVWLLAAGQIFFTLSVGIGVILTYASYLEKKDDVALSGLTAASANEFAEVILGGSIVVPAAYAFFGPQGTAGSIFDIGFITMPMVLGRVPAGHVLGCAWFLLLFLAGITSSISLIQPALAFLEDEFGLTKREACTFFVLVTFLMCQAVIFGFGGGVLDEFDFWGGTFCLVLFGTIETILFAWVFGMDRAWTELHTGADITIPTVYRYVIKYVTPCMLLAILGYWIYQEGWAKMIMKDVPPEKRPFILGTRLILLGLFLVLAMMVKVAWRKRRERGETV